MTKSQKLLKTRDEIERNFRHIFDSMLLSSKSYDEGFKGEAARLANVVYILVHDYGKTTSLLTQLDRKKIGFVNTSRPINPNNLLTEMPLVIMHLSTDGMDYLPRLAEASAPPPVNWPPFRPDTWA